MKIKFLLISILIFVAKADAQNVINTDRPDQSDGTHIVEQKHFQIESGVQFSKFDELTTGFDNVTLVRYGVSRKFEIRILNQYSRITDSNSIAGFKPPTISFKNQLCKQNGLLPKLTLVSYINLPITINPEFPGTYTGYTVTLAARHDVTSAMKIYSNFGFTRDQQSKDISYLGTLEANYNITNTFSAFVEYFGNYSHLNNSNGLDIGFIYAIKNNFALDVSLGSPTLKLPVSKFISCGISLRLPNSAKKHNS